MPPAEFPANEAERLTELHALNVLDTMPEQAYDDITYLAAQICETPIALVSLIDEERQWFKSRIGLEAQETHRDLAFCGYAILEPNDVLVVPDATQDGRFANNPLVLDDPSIRFYAGAPLVSSSGNSFGTLCVIDRVPRTLSDDQETSLRALSRQVMAQLDLRRMVQDLRRVAADRLEYQKQLEDYQRRLEASLASATQESLTDPLTGLNNRRAFVDRLGEELLRVRRYDTPLTLVMIDVDHFKAYNDEFGHAAGDGALENVARLLVESRRAADIVARYGGEEFAVVLPNTGSDGGLVMAERFRQSVEQANWDGRPLTISVGVATARRTTTLADLIEAADAALYEAKRAGRNQVVAASAQ